MAPEFAAQPDFKLTFAATMPLKVLPRFSVEELVVAVNCILMDTGAVAELEPELTAYEEAPDDGMFWHRAKEPPRVGLTVNGVTIQVEGCDRPAYDSTGLAQLDVAAWPDVRERISRTRSHVHISEVWTMGGSDFDHNCDRAAALTVVIEAVAQLTEAVGVVWHSSNSAVPIDQLSTLFALLKEGQTPMQLWIGCSGRQEEETGATTRGLYPFIGAEIEVASTNLSRDIAYKVALDVIAEIFRTGKPPAKGAQLNLGNDHVFSVDFHIGNRKPHNESDLPKVVLTQVILPVESEAKAGAA